VARGLAVLGMYAVHLGPNPLDGAVWFKPFKGHSAARSSRCSPGLDRGGRRPKQGCTRVALRPATRAPLLVALGLLLLAAHFELLLRPLADLGGRALSAYAPHFVRSGSSGTATAMARKCSRSPLPRPSRRRAHRLGGLASPDRARPARMGDGVALAVAGPVLTQVHRIGALSLVCRGFPA
jgi:hypothetical protein